MDYLSNINSMIIQANDKALHTGSPASWNNVKRKNRKKISPRGPFFSKYSKQVRSSKIQRTFKDLELSKNQLSKGLINE